MLEKLSNPDDVRSCAGNIPVEYVYTAGVAGEAFLRAIKERGRLVASGCPGCGASYLPARLYCERCFEQTTYYQDVEARGTVHAFTLAWYDLNGKRLDRPEVYAFVHIDGTGGGLVHRLGEIDPEQVYIGLPVEAVFLPAGQRVGSVLDIDYFRPSRL